MEPPMSMRQSRNTLIQALSEGDQGILLRNATQVDLRYGESFCQPGATIECVFFPERGLHSLVTSTADGAIVETGVVGIEGAVGLTEALANAPFFPIANTQV